MDDANYLIKKLKKERNEYLQKYKKLEAENLHIKETIKEKMEAFTEHHERRLEIRSSIYVEEIQELIERFNDNYDDNREVVWELLQEFNEQRI